MTLNQSKAWNSAQSRLESSIYSLSQMAEMDIDEKDIHEIVVHGRGSRKNIPKEHISYVKNMRDAWTNMPQMINMPNDFKAVKTFAWNVNYDAEIPDSLRNRPMAVKGCSYVAAVPNRDEVDKELALLCTIESIKYRAAAIYAYCAKKQMFGQGNEEVAFLMCNKMLIENGVGIFIVPKDKLSTFVGKLLSYYDNDVATPFLEFIVEECIEDI